MYDLLIKLQIIFQIQKKVKNAIYRCAQQDHDGKEALDKPKLHYCPRAHKGKSMNNFQIRILIQQFLLIFPENES
jgi:hypothetical protein